MFDEGRHQDFSSTKTPLELWHQLMAHPNLTMLKALYSKNIINIASWTKEFHISSSCQMRKNCKLHLELSNKFGSLLLENIHCDLWSTAPIISTQNYRFYAIFIDDYSKFT